MISEAKAYLTSSGLLFVEETAAIREEILSRYNINVGGYSPAELSELVMLLMRYSKLTHIDKQV